MIQRLGSHLGSLDKNFQVLDDLRLTRKFLNMRWTDIIFKLLINGRQAFFTTI